MHHLLGQAVVHNRPPPMLGVIGGMRQKIKNKALILCLWLYTPSYLFSDNEKQKGLGTLAVINFLKISLEIKG